MTAIKSRRDYRHDTSGEIVRVTGWTEVTTGTGSAAYPLRTERWCRIRYAGERVSTMLMHPSRLREVQSA